MIDITVIIFSVFITIVLIPILSKLALKFGGLDMPEPRKIHALPIPRIGGVAIAIGVFVPVILWATPDDFTLAYLVGAGILVAFGLVDDLKVKGLGYKMKFLGQICASLVVVIYGGVRITYLGSLLPDDMVLMDGFAVALTLAAVVGVTNAINLADGLDGLAGGISLLGFCCLAYFAYITGSNETSLIALSMVGAIFGFLRFNTHPASIFMGDTGSQLLGFTAAVLAVKITQEHVALSPVLPLIILGFPILDTLTVMVERIIHGRSPFAPDKTHFHHRLISLGFFHSESVFIIYLIQSMMILAAIIFRYHFAWSLMVGYTLFSTVVIGSFAIAGRTEFQVPRYHLIDRIIKDKLRMIKDDKMIIRISFEIVKLLLPLILLFSCLLPAQIPGYASLMALFFSFLLLAVWIFWKNLLGLSLRLILFLIIPLTLYLGETERLDLISLNMLKGFHLAFVILAFFVIFSIKFSRRVKGFRVTTMDYLIIFIALVVPNLPGQVIQSQFLGVLAVKLIVLLFGYEVLITELRGKFDALAVSTLAALAIVGLRGII